MHQVDVEIVEDFRVTPQGVRKGRTGFHLILHFPDRFSQHFILGLGREDFEALHQWQTSVDHRAELPRKDDQIFISEAGPETDLESAGAAFFLFEAGDDDTLLAKLIHRLIAGFCAQLALLGSA